MVTDGFDLVEKEVIGDFNFPAEEILRKESEISIRRKALDRAIALGNLEHHKVRIYFADDQGNKYVETTIWGLTDHEILLKKNVMVPINRVIKIEI